MAYKPRPRCIICGGTVTKKDMVCNIPICHRDECRSILSYKLTGAMPLVTVNPYDFSDQELIPQEEADALDQNPTKFYAIVRTMRDIIWDDYMGETYNTALARGTVELEALTIQSTPIKELPSLFGTIKDPENEKLLAQRLRDGK